MGAEKWVILDRDGVINEDSPHYIKSPAEWHAVPGSIEAIARLCQAGWQVAIATNQSGLARGLYDLATLEAIHAKMLNCIAKAGGRIAKIVFCPHGPADGCACRKPKTGLFTQLAAECQINLGGIPAVGDSLRDLQAARAAGALPILVRTGKGAATVARLSEAGLADIPVYPDLAHVVDALLASPQ